MPRQLIYTSAPRLFDHGKTGYGTVARSSNIGGTLVRLLERNSQYPRHCPEEDLGAIFTYRIIEADGETHHVLSRIVRAGADYSGRANHLAHHLICSKEEVDLLMRHPSAPTPAGLILALSAANFWKNQWTDAPAVLPDEFAFSARYLPNPAEQAAWQDLTGHKRNALLPCTLPYAEGCYIVVPDSCDPATELMLNHESDWLSPERGWGSTFTTHLCSTDMADSFLRIYVHEGSANIQRMRRSRRPILRLHEEMHRELDLAVGQEMLRTEEDEETAPVPDPPSTPVLPERAAPSAQTIALKPLKHGRSYRYSDSEETIALAARPSRRRVRHMTALAIVVLLVAGAAYAYHLISQKCPTGAPQTSLLPPPAAISSAPEQTVSSQTANAVPEPAPADAPQLPEEPQPPLPAPTPHPEPEPAPADPEPESTPLPPLQSRLDMLLKEGDELPADLACLLQEGRSNLETADMAWIDLADDHQNRHLRSSFGSSLKIREEEGRYLFERLWEDETTLLLTLHVKDGTFAGVKTPGGHAAACSLTAENAEGVPVRFLFVPAIRLQAFPLPKAPHELPEPDLASRGGDWYPTLDRETRTYRFTPEQIYGSEALEIFRLTYATRPVSPPSLPVFPDMNRQEQELSLANVLILPDGWEYRAHSADTSGNAARFVFDASVSFPVDHKADAEDLVDRILNKNLGAHGGPEVSLAYIYRLVWSIREKKDEQALTRYLNLFAKPQTREYLRDLLGETPRQHSGNRRTRIAPPLTLTARDAGNRIARRRIAAELRKPESTARLLAALRADMQRRLVNAARALPPPPPTAGRLTLVLKEIAFRDGKLEWLFEPIQEQQTSPGSADRSREK